MLTPSENQLFESATEKCKTARRLVDELVGNREVLGKRYISASRLKQLDTLLSDVKECIDTLHLTRLNEKLGELELFCFRIEIPHNNRPLSPTSQYSNSSSLGSHNKHGRFLQ